MLEGIFHLIAKRPWSEVAIDIVDLFLVSYIIYRVLLVMRGTRAMQIGVGLGVVLLVYFVSKWAQLVTLVNLLSYLLSSFVLVVVVVFQNDIRRGLMRVGSHAVFSGRSRQQETRIVEEVVTAATELARHRIGAIICFEQEANLDEFIASGGTVLDAAVQRDLLVSLFVPEGINKLHDGAVIIRNLRIAMAGVFFPMPETKGDGATFVDKSMGTRHRAAIGVSDETDAVVVVVSEERGTISVCFNGNIIPNLDGMTLRQALLGLLGDAQKKKRKAKEARSEEARKAKEGRRAPTSARAPSLHPPQPSKPEWVPTPVSAAPLVTPRSPSNPGDKPVRPPSNPGDKRIPSVSGTLKAAEPEKRKIDTSANRTVAEPVTMPMQAASTTQLPVANDDEVNKDEPL